MGHDSLKEQTGWPDRFGIVRRRSNRFKASFKAPRAGRRS
jgi:hypothetical protein